jgi:hypothetical protein
VAVSGDIAVVGACNHQVGGKLRQGAAYVYVQSGSTWNLEAELTASDGAEQDAFGRSVAVSGSTAIVASHHGGGAAYVFERSGTTWSQEAELTPGDSPTTPCCDLVAVSGSTAVASGTVNENLQTVVNVFVRSGTTWSQEAQLEASGGHDQVSFSLATSADTLILGHYAKGDPGVADVFVRSGGIWSLETTLTASDGAAGDGFGTSVAVDGSAAVVGAQWHQVGNNAYQGAAYVFVQSGTTWSQQAELRWR